MQNYGANLEKANDSFIEVTLKKRPTANEVENIRKVCHRNLIEDQFEYEAMKKIICAMRSTFKKTEEQEEGKKFIQLAENDVKCGLLAKEVRLAWTQFLNQLWLTMFEEHCLVVRRDVPFFLTSPKQKLKAHSRIVKIIATSIFREIFAGVSTVDNNQPPLGEAGHLIERRTYAYYASLNESSCYHLYTIEGQ